MNIGIDIRPLMTNPRTGVGEYTFELLRSIFEIDRQNQYFLFYNSWQDVSKNIPDWQYDNVRIVTKNYSNKIFNGSVRLFGWPKLDRLASGPRDKTPDIFFSPNLNFTALCKKTKFILTVHDLSFNFFPEFSTIKQYWWHKIVSPQKQCNRADIILAPSENTKRDIVEYYGIASDKIRVLYPGVKRTTDYGLRTTDVKNKYNLPEKYILFLGTIEPRKNITGLIEAFEHINSKENISHHLVVAGAPGWKNKKIFEQAKGSRVKDKIKFIGFIEPEDKPALYAGAELFVYPSLYEGFGFPVLEAMAQGTPVVTSNRSSLPEISGRAAYLVDPTRPEQISLAMNEIISKPKLKAWHIEKGLKQAEKFNWKNSAAEWLNLINKL